MNKLKSEQDFFHFIGSTVSNFVLNTKEKSITQLKENGDFATQVDIDVENIIVNEINKRFPNDQILAEEGYNSTKVIEGRLWLIDPICGTANLARDINNFCTNIALAENNILKASLVIDYNHEEYFWSVGENSVFINHALISKQNKKVDTFIDIDFGALVNTNYQIKEKHNRILKKLITETDYYPMSINSSLSFAYTAIGKIDGFINVFNKPWDISAAGFLLQQAGGVITDIEGNPWKIGSNGAVGANDPQLHNKLMEIIRGS